MQSQQDTKTQPQPTMEDFQKAIVDTIVASQRYTAAAPIYEQKFQKLMKLTETMTAQIETLTKRLDEKDQLLAVYEAQLAKTSQEEKPAQGAINDDMSELVTGIDDRVIELEKQLEAANKRIAELEKPQAELAAKLSKIESSRIVAIAKIEATVQPLTEVVEDTADRLSDLEKSVKAYSKALEETETKTINEMDSKMEAVHNAILQRFEKLEKDNQKMSATIAETERNLAKVDDISKKFDMFSQVFKNIYLLDVKGN